MDKPDKTQNSDALPSVIGTYKRARWKHYSRFVALAGLGLIDAMMVLTAIHSAEIHPLVTPAAIAKECVTVGVLMLCNLFVLPSIVLEADKVQLSTDKVSLWNLLWKTDINWQEIKTIVAPAYLKFAIVNTENAFYLINKRDVEGFDELLHTMRDKTGAQTK
jgi:hypothetical protein